MTQDGSSLPLFTPPQPQEATQLQQPSPKRRRVVPDCVAPVYVSEADRAELWFGAAVLQADTVATGYMFADVRLPDGSELSVEVRPSPTFPRWTVLSVRPHGPTRCPGTQVALCVPPLPPVLLPLDQPYHTAQLTTAASPRPLSIVSCCLLCPRASGTATPPHLAAVPHIANHSAEVLNVNTERLLRAMAIAPDGGEWAFAATGL